MVGVDRPPPPLVDQLIARLSLISEIRWHAAVGSTNQVVARAAAEGAATGLVVGADVQTAGRGRRGRAWYAPPGSSLMCSTLLRPTLPPSSWSLLPLVTGTAVLAACRGVLPHVDPGRLALKWPNDLLVEGIKTAGILVESTSGVVVVGIGVNVDWRGVSRPDGLQVTSLAEVAGADVDRWDVLGALLESLDHHHRLAEADPTGVVQRYVVDCGTIGERVIAHGHHTIEGTAVGLTPDGHLRIRADDGRDHIVTAGDVEHLR